MTQTRKPTATLRLTVAFYDLTPEQADAAAALFVKHARDVASKPGAGTVEKAEFVIHRPVRRTL